MTIRTMIILNIQTCGWMALQKAVCKCRCDGSLAQRLPVSLDLSCKPFTCAVSVIPTDDGRYRCTYTPDSPGFYRLEVTCQDVHLGGSPFSVQVATSVLQRVPCPHQGLHRPVPQEVILFVLLPVLASAFFCCKVCTLCCQ